MARRSLVLGLVAMTNAACLMTSTPQFKPQKHTAPFLLESTASPDPRAVYVIDSAQMMGTGMTITFQADVVSQDDASGFFSQVQPALYFDYGHAKFAGQPPYFPLPILGNALTPGGTLDQTGRTAKVNWFVGEPDLDPGCHTVTLVVSHQFEPYGCPVCAGDYSLITWQVLRCDSSLGTCSELALAACPVHTGDITASTCDQFQETMDAGVSCPDPSSNVTP